MHNNNNNNNIGKKLHEHELIQHLFSSVDTDTLRGNRGFYTKHSKRCYASVSRQILFF